MIIDRVTKSLLFLAVKTIDRAGVRQDLHTIHTLEDILRACVIYFTGSWDNQLPLKEFTTIIVTIHAFGLTFMRQCMGVHVGL